VLVVQVTGPARVDDYWEAITILSHTYVTVIRIGFLGGKGLASCGMISSAWHLQWVDVQTM
jgi:hypothetical protein